MIRPVVTVLVVLLALGAHGGEQSWTSSGPETGIVTAVRFDPSNPNIVFAGLRNIGIFRSTDGGLHWSLVNGGVSIRDSSVIVVDPSNGSNVYAGSTSGSMYKSTDGGTTWVSSSTGLFAGGARITALVIDPQNPSTLYVGTTSDAINPSLGVQRSTNGGASWSDSGGASLGTKNVYALGIDPQNPSTIYAGGLFDNADRPMFKSTNGGASWVSISTNLLGSSVEAIGVDPATSGTLLIATPTGVQRSTNGGTSWSSTSGLGFSTAGKVIVFERGNASSVWLGSISDVYRSTNGGSTWTAAKIANKRIRGLDVASNGLVLAGTADSGLYRRPPGASSWSESNAGVTATRILSLAVHPSTPGTLFAGTEETGLFRSTDYGRTWSRPTNDFLLGMLSAIAIDPKTPATMFAGTSSGSGPYKTTNGGDSWSLVGFLSQIHAIAIDPVTTSTIYVGYSSGVSKSTNGGTSFNPASSGLPSFTAVTAVAIDPVSTMTVFAAVNGQGLYKTTDGAANWVKKATGLTSSDVRAILVDPHNASRVFVATGGGVFRSTDGGESWSPSNSGITTTSIRSLWIDPSDSQKVYAGTTSAGVFQSSDGGASWTLMGGVSPALSIVALAGTADGNVVHAGGNGGVWSWQFRPFEPVLRILSPGNGGSVVNGTHLSIEIENFTLDCATTGTPNQARGHWRLEVDGTLDSTGCTLPPRLTKTYSLGAHTIRLSLRNPDGSSLVPAVESSVNVVFVQSLPKRRSARK